MPDTKIAVISMGQLMSTTLDASVAAFAEASGHSDMYVKAMLAIDELPFGRGYIREYKEGSLSEAEFFDGLRHRLSRNEVLLPDDAIRDAWNAMTGIRPEHEDKVRAVAEAVINNDLRLVVASGTNALHQEANLKALERVLAEDYAPFMERTAFALSHEEHTLHKARLAASGIMDVAGTSAELVQAEVATFHRDIAAADIHTTLVENESLGVHTAKLLKVTQVPTTGADLAEKLSSFGRDTPSRKR